MSKYNDAAKALAREAARTEGLLQAAKVLGEAGALESVVADLEARHAKAQKDLEGAEASVNAARVDAARITEEANLQSARADQTVKVTLQRADEQAEQIVRAARDLVVAENLSQFNRQTESARVASEKLAVASAQLAAALEALNEVQNRVDERRKEADALDARIERARASAARMLGDQA